MNQHSGDNAAVSTVGSAPKSANISGMLARVKLADPKRKTRDTCITIAPIG
jgi:hypothetical protein